MYCTVQCTYNLKCKDNNLHLHTKRRRINLALSHNSYNFQYYWYRYNTHQLIVCVNKFIYGIIIVLLLFMENLIAIHTRYYRYKTLNVVNINYIIYRKTLNYFVYNMTNDDPKQQKVFIT